LGRLFANFPRIDDEFERIRDLILFHQLQISGLLSALRETLLGAEVLTGLKHLPSVRLKPSEVAINGGLELLARSACKQDGEWIEAKESDCEAKKALPRSSESL